MPDKNFHRRSASFSLKEIAEFSGARLADGADPTYVIDDVAPLNVAGPKDLAFLDNVKYKTQMQATKAGACFIKPDLVELAPKGMRLLISTEPYKAYARAAQAMPPGQQHQQCCTGQP